MADAKTLFQNRIIGYDTKPADQFLFNPLNYRKHPQRQRDAVNGSLKELGWIAAVVENMRTGNLVDGHERVWQALQNNEDVPYLQVDLSEEEERLALAIFDPLTNMAETDAEILDELLREVNTGDATLQGLLAELATGAGLYPNGKSPEPVDVAPQIDRAEELGAKWGTAEGQIWQIGPHVIICGDCRETETWRRLLSAAGVQKVNGVFTSPPYAEQRKEQYGGVPADQYVDWWEAVQANVQGNLADDGSFFVNIKPHCEDGQRVLYVMDLVLATARRWGWRYVDELCWVNQGFPGNMGDRFKNQFEPIYHFSFGNGIKFFPESVAKDLVDPDEGSIYQPGQVVTLGRGPLSGKGGTVRSKNIDGALPGNVLRISKGITAKDSGAYQAASFPVQLPDFFIRAYSDPGDVWLDPFLGSGTTIVAAHQNDRVGLGIEKLPKYIGVDLERLQQVVGVEPVRIG